MQIPILTGSFTDDNSDFRTSYPKNLVPVPKKQGISLGYLRPAYGIVPLGTGSGVDRGAINWKGSCYRVSGTKLIQVATDGTTTVLGDVGGTGQCSMDYSFDRLSVTSGEKLFYWDGVTLTEVTDPDAGVALTHIWVDGYFMWNDDENLVVSELTDPTDVNPLKYGSSEIDPDPVMAVIKVRNEPHAVNRHTIEPFYNNPNAGANEFPFQRVENAQTTKGAVGSFACCEFDDSVAFVGGDRDESNAVYLAANGSWQKISDQEVDKVINDLTDSQLADIVCEKRFHESHSFLYVHLPDRTLVYDLSASKLMQQPVWHEWGTGRDEHNRLLCRNMVWCYNEWIVGDPDSSQIGTLSNAVGSHWGELNGWRFDTGIIYNSSRKLQIHELEFVALTGRVALGTSPQIWTSHSTDGVEPYSQPRYIDAGEQGQRNKRLRLQGGGIIDNWRIQRTEGTSDSHLSFARIEARVEPMNW